MLLKHNKLPQSSLLEWKEENENFEVVVVEKAFPEVLVVFKAKRKQVILLTRCYTGSLPISTVDILGNSMNRMKTSLALRMVLSRELEMPRARLYKSGV